jgi:ribosomal protein S18 acetylase RimI-like enzyme
MAEAELQYIHRPTEARPLPPGVEFVNLPEFLADEPACKTFWELISNQFRTRSKFLAIWQCVKHVCVHRDADGNADGFLLVSAPVNWQIDYVVVKPESRGRGIASKLVSAALSHAYLHRAPYVMLTSKESLRPLYETSGFMVIPQPASVLKCATG